MLTYNAGSANDHFQIGIPAPEAGWFYVRAQRNAPRQSQNQDII